MSKILVFNTDGTVNDSQLAIKYPVKRIDFLDSNIRKNIIVEDSVLTSISKKYIHRLIYENKDVSAGGIDYLIDKKRIYEWIFESRRQIVNCENYCKDGCGKCVYCSDPLCHPVWSKELEKTYVNNNKLLARSLAAQFIDL